jgi:CO dehydrogenase/acetyl-CoA synthase epsilon subunit
MKRETLQKLSQKAKYHSACTAKSDNGKKCRARGKDVKWIENITDHLADLGVNGG